jgi:hypothetical protein
MRSKKLLPQAVAASLVVASALVCAGESEIKQTGIGKLLNGRSYVRMEKDATCKANNPEHTVIKTWANKISFENGQILIWGKVCNDSPESIFISQAGKNLFISADLRRIVYKNEVLRYFKDAPKLCDDGQWCPVEADKP